MMTMTHTVVIPDDMRRTMQSFALDQVQVGRWYGLYDTLADLGTAMPADLAVRSGLPRDDVAGWLEGQARSGYIHRIASRRFCLWCDLSEQS